MDRVKKERVVWVLLSPSLGEGAEAGKTSAGLEILKELITRRLLSETRGLSPEKGSL